MNRAMKAKPYVLVVDDKPMNVSAMKQLLEDLDCEIVTATSGQQALRLAWQHDFALALLDVEMPGMNGLEVAETMHNSDRTKHVPIIFVTGNTDKHAVKKYLATGAIGYLFKPVEPEMLKTKVNVFLNLYSHRVRKAA